MKTRFLILIHYIKLWLLNRLFDDLPPVELVKSLNLVYCWLIKNICLSMRALIMKFKSELKSNRDLQIVFVAVLFYASACLGYFLKFDNTYVLPAWPPSG